MTPVEIRLRESLGAYAEQVTADPDGYERVHQAWRRRDRRRRRMALAVASVLVVVVDVVGLWALDQAGPRGAGVLFDHPAPVELPVGP